MDLRYEEVEVPGYVDDFGRDVPPVNVTGTHITFDPDELRRGNRDAIRRVLLTGGFQEGYWRSSDDGLFIRRELDEQGVMSLIIKGFKRSERRYPTHVIVSPLLCAVERPEAMSSEDYGHKYMTRDWNR
jgi:hypothetical protein